MQQSLAKAAGKKSTPPPKVPALRIACAQPQIENLQHGRRDVVDAMLLLGPQVLDLRQILAGLDNKVDDARLLVGVASARVPHADACCHELRSVCLPC